MRIPFDGDYPISRPFIGYDPSMPSNLWDPVYGATHRGIDWALPSGTKLVAAITGVITFAGFSQDGAGNTVVIRNGMMLVKCFHLSRVSVALGQQVVEHQEIGFSGSSGNSTGPHLHFQVEDPAGVAVNPMNYLKGGEDMAKSTVGEIEFNYLFTDAFGPMSRNEPTAYDRQRWIGGETNTVIRQMREDPRHASYQQYIRDVEESHNVLAEENQRLRDKLTGADPDGIVITQNGWQALWEAIKSFFNKNR